MPAFSQAPCEQRGGAGENREGIGSRLAGEPDGEGGHQEPCREECVSNLDESRTTGCLLSGGGCVDRGVEGSTRSSHGDESDSQPDDGMGEPRQHDRPGEEEQRRSDETATKPVTQPAGDDHRGQGPQADEEERSAAPSSATDASTCCLTSGSRTPQVPQKTPKPANAASGPSWLRATPLSGRPKGLRNADMSGHVLGSDPRMSEGDVSVTPILGPKRSL